MLVPALLLVQMVLASGAAARSTTYYAVFRFTWRRNTTLPGRSGAATQTHSKMAGGGGVVKDNPGVVEGNV